LSREKNRAAPHRLFNLEFWIYDLEVRTWNLRFGTWNLVFEIAGE